MRLSRNGDPLSRRTLIGVSASPIYRTCANRRYRAQPGGFAKPAFPGRTPRQVKSPENAWNSKRSRAIWLGSVKLNRAARAPHKNFGFFCLRGGGRGRILRLAKTLSVTLKSK